MTGDYFAARQARRAEWTIVSEQRRWSFAAIQLVIVDEASLADTRTLATLTAQARDAGANVLGR